MNIGLQIVAVTVLDSEWRGIVHLTCPRCRMPSAALVDKDAVGGMTVNHMMGHPGEIGSWGYKVEKFWPAIPSPEVPELIPPNVARVYLQAERNFQMEGNEEAAGTMYRKALDVGLKVIDPSQSGMLGPRIKKLAAEGKLTADIAIWSDNIRDVGNEAAHDEDPITRDELIALRNFSEMVLRYLFSLPGAVKKRRGENLGWEIQPVASKSPPQT